MITPITVWDTSGGHKVCGIDIPEAWAQRMKALNDEGYCLHTRGNEFWVMAPGAEEKASSIHVLEEKTKLTQVMMIIDRADRHLREAA